MSPERELLLACARTQMTPEHEAAIAARVALGLDWNALGAMAGVHGLSPLLHRHLGERADVPKTFRAALWARHESFARRNAAMARELSAIVHDLKASGLDAVPYKGPTLALSAYGNVALREFGDLDLLVRSSDALAVARQLERRGYEIEYRLSPASLERLVRSRRHYELPLRNKRGGLLVELHWRTDPEFDLTRLDDPTWWAHLQRCEINGVTIPALPPHELLLALCLHGTKHGWCSLGWLVDVAELVRATPILDWQWVTMTAQGAGAERHVALGLLLARRLLDLPLPSVAESLVASARMDALADDVERAMFANTGSSHGASYVHQRLRLRKGPLAKARFGLQAALTPGLGDWQRWPSIPPAFSFLYWLLRPIRLAEKYLLRRTPPAATPRTPPPRPHSTG